MKASYALFAALGLVCAPGPCDAQSSQAPSMFQVVPTPNLHPRPYQNDVERAAASSRSDIWAVGQSTLHFDGTRWKAFPAPMINGDNTSYLDGVVDISPTEAWAAGIVGIGTANPGQVIERWDGGEWSVFPGPAFQSGEQPEIFGMTAVSANNIWAVGTMLINNQFLEALFEHWDGHAWTASTGTFYGFFQAVSARAADDIWAVGYSGLNSVTMAEHYDGHDWTLVPTPNVGTGPNSLNAVLALAADDVWAVGYSTATQKPPPHQFDVPTKTLIEHFDGKKWSVVPSPNVGPHSQYQSNRLLGITAVAPNNIWAFGSYFAASGSGSQITLLLHWDGTSWSLAPCPNPTTRSPQSNILWGE